MGVDKNDGEEVFSFHVEVADGKRFSMEKTIAPSENFWAAQVSLKPSPLVLVLLLVIAAAPSAFAQDSEKPAFDPSKAKDAGLGMPSPYDKFLSLAIVAKGSNIDWKSMFNAVSTDIDPDQWQDANVAIPLALGLRIADGVMAIQARDAEFLGQCASDIEKLAPKLGVSDSDMKRARLIRSLANEGKWLNVFMELGFLQQDILQTLQKDEQGRGDLVIASGWMQGARYTTSVILENYSGEASNVLREPMLAKAIGEKIDVQPEAVKKHPAIESLSAAIPKITEIVDVKLDAPIPEDQVKEINQLANDYVNVVLESK